MFPMRSLHIVAVALLGSALSAASAQQPSTHPAVTKGARSEKASKASQPAAPAQQHVRLAPFSGGTQLNQQTAPNTGTQALPKTHPTSGGGSHHDMVSGGSDSCATATAIAGPGPFLGDNIGASLDGLNNCAAFSSDVWYNWTSGFTGNALVSLCGSNYDTQLAVYDTAACVGSLLGCGDDSSCGLQSQLTVPVVNGQVYKIQVGGFSSSQGNYTLSITPPAPPPNCPCSGNPPEGEFCGIPTDTVNGGCNYGPPFLYGSLACNSGVCGTGGYDGSTRDLDWYAFTLPAPDTITLTVTAEFL